VTEEDPNHIVTITLQPNTASAYSMRCTCGAHGVHTDKASAVHWKTMHLLQKDGNNRM